MLPYPGQPQFAEGGEVGYTYDPVTQMYVKKGGEGATLVSPTGGISGASSGASVGPDQPLNQQTLDFLNNETKEARDARVSDIGNVIGQIAGLAVPGMGALGMARDLGLTGIGGIANFFGGTQAPADVTNAGFSRGIGDGISDGIGGEGIGGGDISGASADTPALARGGISNLGDYSDGGRLLRGPGDGISDSIPAMIGKKQPARLADGEFVVPARIVSELGNGSTEAGARKLYAMMDRVQKARKKTVGKGKVAANSRSAKYLPA
jgi:hypothetical protein